MLRKDRPYWTKLYRQHIVERKHIAWQLFVKSGYRDHAAHARFLAAYVELQRS